VDVVAVVGLEAGDSGAEEVAVEATTEDSVAVAEVEVSEEDAVTTVAVTEEVATMITVPAVDPAGEVVGVPAVVAVVTATAAVRPRIAEAVVTAIPVDIAVMGVDLVGTVTDIREMPNTLHYCYYYNNSCD
jgi:hypothetical protein